jgi:hypothetical protein
MRWLIPLIAIAALGCTEHGKGGGIFCSFNGMTHQPGDIFPAGDGCNSCSCDADGEVSCTAEFCGDGGVIVDAFDTCGPSGGCSDGVFCNGVCCGIGEQCFGGVCSCGGNAACTNGDICATGGPGGMSTCGSICCGNTQPCPL